MAAAPTKDYRLLTDAEKQSLETAIYEKHLEGLSLDQIVATLAETSGILVGAKTVHLVTLSHALGKGYRLASGDDQERAKKMVWEKWQKSKRPIVFEDLSEEIFAECGIALSGMDAKAIILSQVDKKYCLSQVKYVGAAILKGEVEPEAIAEDLKITSKQLIEAWKVYHKLNPDLIFRLLSSPEFRYGKGVEGEIKVRSDFDLDIAAIDAARYVDQGGSVKDLMFLQQCSDHRVERQMERMRRLELGLPTTRMRSETERQKALARMVEMEQAGLTLGQMVKALNVELDEEQEPWTDNGAHKLRVKARKIIAAEKEKASANGEES